jgi:ribosomal protein S18 acetylase RimI-like enzyme
MAELIIVPEAQMLTENQWSHLRDARLAALTESPGEFLSSYQRESTYGEREWRAEFSRGQWAIAFAEGRTVGLLGATWGLRTPAHDCYLEYMWVSPGFRRCGIASTLIRLVLESLRDSGVAVAWLWIFDDNEPARRLYESCGFVSTNEKQPIPGDGTRHEERMTISLRPAPGN